MYPEIYELQSRAIFEAAVTVSQEIDECVIPEIMVPLVSTKKEFEILRELVLKVGSEVEEVSGFSLQYLVGTMIELPRAALRAGEIAELADFFSFGTNDLTQTTYGLSRDDSGMFLDPYIRNGVFVKDPFVTIDSDGGGELIEMAVQRGRLSKMDIKLGICGEHGGDPDSVDFFMTAGLDYVSCSPYRVPIARLAAAHAALSNKAT